MIVEDMNSSELRTNPQFQADVWEKLNIRYGLGISEQKLNKVGGCNDPHFKDEDKIRTLSLGFKSASKALSTFEPIMSDIFQKDPYVHFKIREDFSNVHFIGNPPEGLFWSVVHFNAFRDWRIEDVMEEVGYTMLPSVEILSTAVTSPLFVEKILTNSFICIPGMYVDMGDETLVLSFGFEKNQLKFKPGHIRSKDFVVPVLN